MPFPDAVQDAPPPDDSELAGLVRLAFLSVLGGAVTGVLGGAFRLVLIESWRLWEQFLLWARDLGGWRLLLPVVGAAVAVGLARLIVRWSPESAGSGVQRVEAMMRHESAPAAWRVVPAKFVGGSLALGVGMALGR
ncbi:MAG: chloride channel protein, partial [Candidatus Nanopelagicales bacterium]